MFTTAVMVPLSTPEVVPLKLRNAPAVTAADQFNVPPPVLLTVTVWLPAVFKVTIKVLVPALPLTNVKAVGSTAWGSELVKFTVPV